MGGVTEAVILAAATVGTAMYQHNNQPKPPKPLAMPTEPEVKVADAAPLNAQARRRAATGGRQGTLLTGPQGLGGAGKTLLGS